LPELPVPHSGADEVHRVTREVLSRAEFQPAQPSWWERLLQTILDAIGRWLEAIGAGGRGSIIGTMVLIAVAVVLVVLVVRFTRSVRGVPAVRVAVDEHIGRSPRQWLEEAEGHEAAGRWRDAIRCRYRATLAEMASGGLVEEVAGRTSGEYRATVEQDVPAAAQPFAEVTDAFEQAWYGHGETTKRDVTAMREACRRALDAAGLRPATAGAHG
jgi:hypothetical protein